MRRTLPMMFAAVAAVTFAGSAVAQESSMRGTFVINHQQSDDVNHAIDAAVARMNFVTRPIARGRLRRTNPVYQRVNLAFDQSHITVTIDQRHPIQSPANGQAVKWTREDGEKFDLSTEWSNGRIVQTFRAEDGSRTNTYSISPDGNTLTMDVVVRSPRLPGPVTYKLVFNRAS